MGFLGDKIAVANLDLLNMVIGVDGEENLKKVPSFYGELMREVEEFYEFYREKKNTLGASRVMWLRLR